MNENNKMTLYAILIFILILSNIFAFYLIGQYRKLLDKNMAAWKHTIDMTMKFIGDMEKTIKEAEKEFKKSDE